MIAKKTSKNQLTLPKKAVERFPDVEYFDVRVDDAQITLVPVRPGQLQQVQARLEQLGISHRDVRDAVSWARRGRRSTKR
jgi:hypothetical protein